MGTYKMVTLRMLDSNYTSPEFADRKLYYEKVKLWKALAQEYRFIDDYAKIVGMLKGILREGLESKADILPYYLTLCDLYNYHFNGVPLTVIE